jgi:hypothetical protein
MPQSDWCKTKFSFIIAICFGVLFLLQELEKYSTFCKALRDGIISLVEPYKTVVAIGDNEKFVLILLLIFKFRILISS